MDIALISVYNLCLSEMKQYIDGFATQNKNRYSSNFF